MRFFYTPKIKMYNTADDTRALSDMKSISIEYGSYFRT